MSEQQLSISDLERIAVQYKNLKITNGYLGRNNVKLMQRSNELKDSLIEAIVIMQQVDEILDLTQLPTLQALVDSFFLNEDVANLVPFVQYDQVAATT